MVQGQLGQPESVLLKPNLSEFGLWLLRRRFRFRVVGQSMVPTLYPGDEVLVNRRAYFSCSPAVGDLVVAVHPDRPALKMIKRVDAIASNTCILLGDNPDASTDSRTFGAVPCSHLLGKVTRLFYRVPRA